MNKHVWVIDSRDRWYCIIPDALSSKEFREAVAGKYDVGFRCHLCGAKGHALHDGSAMPPLCPDEATCTITHQMVAVDGSCMDVVIGTVHGS